MRSSEDVYTFGLDMLAAALDASTEPEARDAVRAIASDLSADELRRVSTMLAVEMVWKVRSRRSRRAMREWIELRRFGLLVQSVGDQNA